MTAIKFYRIANKLYLKHIPILPKFFYRMIYLLNNCHVHFATKIGSGTIIAYGGIGVVIHKDAVIGMNCVIESNVTIGGRNNDNNVPVIGNCVFIGTGARILGNVRVGDNCIIGANSVVLHNIPDNCSVAGVPARILHEDINIYEKCNIYQIINHVDESTSH